MAKNITTNTAKIPNSAPEFNKFFNSFGKKLNTSAKSFNFSPNQIRQFKNAFATWNRQWTAFQKAQSAFEKAQKNLQTTQSSANSVVVKAYTKIANSSNNSGQFSSFGIPSNKKSTTSKKTTTRKTTSRTSKSTTKRTTSIPSSVPTMRISTATRGKNVIWVSPSGNSKWPVSALGAVIQYRKNNGSWQTLTTTSEFPFTHVIGSNFNGSFQYRVAYFYGGRQFGAWSKINKVAIKKAA